MMPIVMATPVSAASAAHARRALSPRCSGSGDNTCSLPPSRMPVPASAITPTSSHSSDHAASRDATGRSSLVSWCSLRDVVSPIAPAASASASWAFISARSSAVASSSNARSPIAQVRSAEWPMLAA